MSLVKHGGSDERMTSRKSHMPDLQRRRLIGAGLATAVVGGSVALAASQAIAAPRSRLIDSHWSAFGADAIGPDHQVWSDFLTRYRRLDAAGVARVDYAGVTELDRATLAGYVAAMQAVRPTDLSSDAAFAYWANLYNALTVSLVLEAYPVESIKAVRGGLFNLGPWNAKIATVDERSLSLNDIEHGILRPVWGDARVHYAVNCAAVGCPNLPDRAFAADELEQMLEAAARDYVNNPRGARFDGDRLIVSSIYEWYAVDFGGSDASVIAHLAQYASAELSARLSSASRISDHDYDWALNDGSAPA